MARPLPADTQMLFLPCAAGVEALLEAEVKAILGRSRGVVAARGGVRVPASAPDAMRLNLHSRLAQRVLWCVAEGPYRHEDDLYELARTVDWREWILPRRRRCGWTPPRASRR